MPNKKTFLDENPFAILGVTPRDNRSAIIERAEEKALHIDPELCQKARADLSNPRSRIAAEIRWLPGVAPRQAERLISELPNSPIDDGKVSGLPVLAEANLMAARLQLLDPESSDVDTISTFLDILAWTAESMPAEDILRDINEDRAVAGFPEIRDLSAVEQELQEQHRFIKTIIRDFLDLMPSEMLVETMDTLVSNVTDGGDEHGPSLVHDLVDTYELEAQGFLIKEEENIEKLIEVARQNAPHGSTKVDPVLEKLSEVTGNWVRVAHPIQMSMKSRGVDHKASSKVAYSIRSLGIDLFNNHRLLESAERSTQILLEHFESLSHLTDRVLEDQSTLEKLRKESFETEKEKEQWARSITFRTEIGLMFKDVLAISPSGIDWKDTHYVLKEITGVRWGAVRKSVNGIPSGTDYHIAFGDHKKSSEVLTNKEANFGGFVNALWRAVGPRLVVELCEALKAGKTINFGGISVRDTSFGVERHRFMGTNETVWVPLNEAHVWSADGSFYVGAVADKKVYGAASYIHHWNTHVLDQLVRSAFKKGTKGRLSAYIED